MNKCSVPGHPQNNFVGTGSSRAQSTYVRLEKGKLRTEELDRVCMVWRRQPLPTSQQIPSQGECQGSVFNHPGFKWTCNSRVLYEISWYLNIDNLCNSNISKTLWTSIVHVHICPGLQTVRYWLLGFWWICYGFKLRMTMGRSGQPSLALLPQGWIWGDTSDEKLFHFSLLLLLGTSILCLPANTQG